MDRAKTDARHEVVDFATLPACECPCGIARRAFLDTPDYPLSIHSTEISADARAHYHKTLTETYYILECGPGGALELDGRRVPVAPGMAILIRPGVRHRAVGRMRVLIVVWPKFDPADEWED